MGTRASCAGCGADGIAVVETYLAERDGLEIEVVVSWCSRCGGRDETEWAVAEEADVARPQRRVA